METTTKISRTKTILMCCLITFLIAVTVSCFGQDTIITRKGDKILSKVLEVSPKEIRYKKFENSDGPLYIEEISTLSKIRYSNGLVDSFPELKPWQLPSVKAENIPAPKKNPELKKIGRRYWYGDKILNENEMQDLLLTLGNVRLTQQIKAARQAKGWQYIGFLAIPLGAASLGYLIESQRYHPNGTTQIVKTGETFLGLAVISVGASIYFKINRNKKNAEAVRLYKQYY